MIKYKKVKWSNLFFIIIILALLLIPQTRTYLQVQLNRLKLNYSPFTPQKIATVNQVQLEPFEYKVRSLDGISVNTSIGNGKVIFISYWATWCPPCIAELPSIEALYADYGNKVTFLLITNEAPKTVKRFLEKKELNIPAVTSDMPAPELLYERSIPTNYIIDKEGKIILKEQGASDWNSEEVRFLLDELLIQ